MSRWWKEMLSGILSSVMMMVVVVMSVAGKGCSFRRGGESELRPGWSRIHGVRT